MIKKKIILLVISIFVVAGYLLLSETRELQEGESAQTGVAEISDSNSYKHEVSFPKEFISVPRIEVSLIKGRGYLDILEKRSDGFIFKVSNLGYTVSEGAHVQWVATGIIAE